MEFLSKRAPLPGEARTLPSKYYTDPGVFRAELERFFCNMWLCAARMDQIPNPGDYFLREFGDESILVVRGNTDSVAAFFNVCRHRGTRLCEVAEGRLPGGIQCPYHGWTYNLEGQLIGAPHMDEVPHFSKEDYPLQPTGLDSWDGHIFINLDGGTRPLSEQLADLPDKFRPWRMEELRLGRRIVYEVKANWKLIIQNYSECLHCPVIHPALQKLSHYLSGENEPPQPTYMGGRMDLRPGAETITVDGRRRRQCLPGLKAEDRTRVYYYAIFPNLLLSLHPDYMMTHTLWPRACDRTEIICEWHFHPEEMARPGFDPNDAVEIWDMTNRQDWHVSELSQLGIRSRAYTPGPYSNREELLHAFDRMILEELL